MRSRAPRPPRATSGPAGGTGRRRPDRQHADADSKDRLPAGVTRMFASVIPGLTPFVTRELNALPGLRVTASGYDGRTDLVLFDVSRGRRDAVWSLRTT